MAGEFKSIHKLAIDGEGNLYTAEVGFGRRVQKFVRWGRVLGPSKGASDPFGSSALGPVQST